MLPVSFRSRLECSKSSFNGSESLWRAVVLDWFGFFSELLKNGGLDTIRSKAVCQDFSSCSDEWRTVPELWFGKVADCSSSCSDKWRARSRLLQGDCRKLKSDWRKAPSSMSMPVITASLQRCAIIKATRPLPHPISSTCFTEGFTGVQAPSKTPSVPTFIAHRLCHTVNCLKRKKGAGIKSNGGLNQRRMNDLKNFAQKYVTENCVQKCVTKN